jgi:Fe2+ or Zn2+ uptake regulation protein
MADSSPPDLATELARCGLRATRQRLAVLGLLRRLDHPTAAELHRRVLREQPNVSKKTVYEVLDALVRCGLASCVAQGGEPFRYEARDAAHYHARCRVCGRLHDVPAGAEGALLGHSSLPEGFRTESIQVTFVGVCPRCRDEV